MFLCLFFLLFLFLPYCICCLLFQGSSMNSFFFLVSALLSLVQWFVWASYRVRLCWVFVCFSSYGQGWVRWSPCLLMIGFVFLFCFLFRWGVLHRVLLVVGWCQVLYSSGFLCVSPHYLVLPRVSSLVVLVLWVSVPTPKAQGLISSESTTHRSQEDSPKIPNPALVFLQDIQ